MSLSNVHKSQRGAFHLIFVLIAILAVFGFVSWRFVSSQKPQSENVADSEEKNLDSNKKLLWQQSENGWVKLGSVPECPDQPILRFPTDIQNVTSVLYPGQTRGGNYKPHGGLRFDNNKNSDIKVYAPLDGFLVRGASYLAEGETQYTFDVMNNCGILFRVGHIREIPDNLLSLTKNWPAPQEGDSRTHQINPTVYIKQGELLGVSVGIINDQNTFFDLGIYDYRNENSASKSSDFRSKHSSDKELSWYAVCWLKGWLPASDEQKLLALPAGDPESGKNSDYCS